MRRYSGSGSSSSNAGGSSSWLFSLRLLGYALVVLVLLYLSYATFHKHDATETTTLQKKKIDYRGKGATMTNLRIEGETINSSKKGFYADTNFVEEITTLSSLEEIRKEKTHILVVFYASWCAHCKKFAPIFISIAEKITSRIQVLNQEYPQHPYSNIHFYAVDCAMYKKICDANRVEYYPVVLPINFPNSNESNKFIEGIETDIYQYLKATIFQHNELELTDRQAVIMAGSSKLQRKHNPLSHLTLNANERYFDALASLMYLLWNDLPSKMTQMQSQSLRQVIDYMYLMMPNVTHPQLSISKEEYALYKQALSAVKLVMLRYSKSPYIPSTKITEALRTLLTTPSGIKLHTDKLIVWKVCGIDTNIASNKWPLSLRGASTEGMRRHEDPASGYTCGLWMMFHYLTIQGEVFSQNQYNISALETMQTIHDFIEIYFGCKDCRSHFLHYYDQAWFQREQIHHAHDFIPLQTWLFQLHNLVSARIILEAKYGLTLPSTWSQHLDEFAQDIRGSFWPHPTQCEACYLPLMEGKEVFASLLAPQRSTKTLVYEDLIREVVMKSFDIQHSLVFLRQAFLTR